MEMTLVDNGRRFAGPGRPACLSACHVVGLMALLVLFSERDAQAYIDPGTGSMAYQMLLASLLGVSFFVRRIVSAVRSRIVSRRKPADASNEPGQPLSS